MPRTNRSGTSEKGPHVGGLMKMFSGGISGGDFVPGKEEESYDDSDPLHEATPQVSVKPGGFTRAQATNPTLDAIFGGGYNSALAAQLNAQQSMAQYQAEVNAKETLKRIQAEKDIAEGRNASAERVAGMNIDAPMLQKAGVPFAGRNDWANVVTKPSVGFAGNEAEARFNASQNPAFNKVVQDKVFAEQQALPIEVRARGAIQAPQNTDVYTPHVGYDAFPNQKISGPTANQRVVMTGGIPVQGADGKVTMYGQKPEILTERSGGSITDTDAAKKREDDIRAELQAAEDMKQKSATQPQYMETNTTPKIRTKPSILPAEDSSFGMGPQFGIKELLQLLQKAGLNKGVGGY